MAGTEEASMEATVKCTAAKSADAVAGNDGPVMRKRKPVDELEGLEPAEGWINESVGAGTASSDPALIDETLHEAKLPATAKQGVDVSALIPVPGRKQSKHRLSKAEIWTILALKPGQLELPTADYLDDLTDVFSPEYIEERKRQTEAYAEVCKKVDAESEAFRQRVIKSVRENGYFEVDDQFLINREKKNQRALEQWAKKDFGGLIFATEEEDAEMEAEPYVLDEEDRCCRSGSSDQ